MSRNPRNKNGSEQLELLKTQKAELQAELRLHEKAMSGEKAANDIIDKITKKPVDPLSMAGESEFVKGGEGCC